MVICKAELGVKMYTATLEPLLIQCNEAIEMATAGRIDEARTAFDRIRSFRALLARDGSYRKAEEEVGDGFLISPELMRSYSEVAAQVNTRLEILHRWISESRAAFTTEELQQSREGMQLLVDDTLPGIWDFKQDIAVLAASDGLEIREILRLRGQAKFIFLAFECHDDSQTHLQGLAAEDTVVVVANEQPSTESIGKLLESRSLPRVALITSVLGEDDEQNFHKLVRTISSVVIAGTTTQWLPQQNVEQWFELLPKLTELSSVMSLKEQFEDADVLVISPGPSLKKDLSALLECKDHFLTIASMKTLDTLFDAGIKPDFAIWQDPRDHSEAIPQRSEISEIPLVLNEGCCPKFYSAPFGKHFPYPEPGFLGSSLSAALHGPDLPVFAGTSVATLSAVMALALGASTVTLLGQDLSVANGMYAGDDEDDLESMKVGEHLTCEAINGGEVPTLPNYLSFIGEFQAIARGFSHKVRLINSTSSGALLEGWEHIPLSLHPLVLEGDGSISKRVIVEPENNSLSERRNAVTAALDQTLDSLDHAARITNEIYKRCLEAVASGDNDVTAIDLLEQRLKVIFDKECPVLKYYTSRQSMALIASTASVRNLEENLRLSADYYHSIGLAAKRLAALSETAKQSILADGER